jgi:hypothetical protein
LSVNWPNLKQVGIFICGFIEKRLEAMGDAIDVSDTGPRSVVPLALDVHVLGWTVLLHC